jgi:hypothetical protein
MIRNCNTERRTESHLTLPQPVSLGLFLFANVAGLNHIRLTAGGEPLRRIVANLYRAFLLL